MNYELVKSVRLTLRLHLARLFGLCPLLVTNFLFLCERAVANPQCLCIRVCSVSCPSPFSQLELQQMGLSNVEKEMKLTQVMSSSFTDEGVSVHLGKFQTLKICSKINQNLVLGNKRGMASI